MISLYRHITPITCFVEECIPLQDAFLHYEKFSEVREVKRGGYIMNIMKKIFPVLITILLGFVNQIQAMEFDDLGGIGVHAFISQGYLKSSDNNFFADTEKGTTQFNEMGINFSADITEKLRLGVQFFARDMGDIGNNEVRLDWAIADYRLRDWLGIRAGNMKWVNGLYNESRDVDMLRTSIFLPQGVYNEAWRETSANLQGAGLYGDIPMSVVGSLAYDAQYGSMNMAPDQGPAKLLKDQITEAFPAEEVDLTDVNVDYTYTGALKWSTPLDGLIIGGSTFGYYFEADATTTISPTLLAQLDPTNAYGLVSLSAAFNGLGITFQSFPTKFEVEGKNLTGSVEFTWRNLVLAAEYSQITYNISIENGLLRTVYPDGIYKIPEFDSIGYYGSASYRFTYWFELGAYYSEYYRNKDDRDGKKRKLNFPSEPEHRAWLKDACLTTRFDINENWVFKLEGHMMNGTAVILGADNPPHTDGTLQYEEDWYLYAAKITYSF